MAKSWTPPPSGFAPPPKGGEKYDLMTYADKLEKLADEASAHDYCFEREYGADCSAGQDLEDRGFVASASGIALACKVAALVRALEDQPCRCVKNRPSGCVYCTKPGVHAHVVVGERAIDVDVAVEPDKCLRCNALADIEGEGE